MSIADEIFEHALASFRAHDGLEAWLALVRASERGLTRADAIQSIGEQAVDELREGVTKWIRKNQA